MPTEDDAPQQTKPTEPFLDQVKVIENAARISRARRQILEDQRAMAEARKQAKPAAGRSGRPSEALRDQILLGLVERQTGFKTQLEAAQWWCATIDKSAEPSSIVRSMQKRQKAAK